MLLDAGRQTAMSPETPILRYDNLTKSSPGVNDLVIGWPTA